MALIKDYIDYFRTLAEQHPALLHTPERRVFEVVSVEEAWGDYRTRQKEKDFTMRLVLPSGGLADGEQSDPMVDAMGGFVIAKYWDKRNEGDAALLEALDLSWEVGQDLVERIIHDSNQGHPLWYFSVNSPAALELSWQPKIYTGDAQYAGWMFIFKWHAPLRNCITHSTAPIWPSL